MLLKTLVVFRLLDDVTLSSSARFVATYVVSSEEHAVTREDLARREQRDVADDDLVHADPPLGATANDGGHSIHVGTAEFPTSQTDGIAGRAAIRRTVDSS